MFYDNRKIIYTIIIVIALAGSFFTGKQMGYSSVVVEPKVEKVVVENIDYNSTLNVKGTGYSFDYSITKAFFTDKTTMNFNVEVQKNENVQTIKVIVKDQDNNVLEVNPNASADIKILNYTTKLNNNTKKITIEVYPLTKEMYENTSLNLSTVPNKNSKLDIELVKKTQIESLQ